MNPIKRLLASAFDLTGLNRASLGLQARRPYIRALNYHEVPAEQADAFEDQLRFYARHFVPVGYADLMEFRAGSWPHPKPGLILTFDDGLRSHAEVAAPLLEKYGVPGWFMVPAGVVGTAAEQRPQEHTVGHPTLTWPDLRRLDGPHVIGCHTHGHRRLEASLTPAELEHEIRDAKRQLEEGLGHPVTVFAWVGGEEWTYSAAAARAIREAGVALSFMTNNAVIRPDTDPLQLQRTNVEASFPASLMRFSLSGFLDVMYTGKRRRVNRLTAAA